jgi:uncharacterized BrkB/YihY/UPF0761 family membrane protein
MAGSSATPLINSVAKAAPVSVRHTVLSTMAHLQNGHAAAGVLAIVGIVAGLWSASGYVAGFMRAANVIYLAGEGLACRRRRPFLQPAVSRAGGRSLPPERVPPSQRNGLVTRTPA